MQAHAALPHRLPEGQQDGAGLWRSRPGQALQDGQQDPVQVGQVVLVETPDVPPHGALHVHDALLPVQTRRLQGRSVDRVVVGRQPLHPARGQVREPAGPVEAGTAQAQVQPFAPEPQDHGHGTLDTPEGQPGLVHLDPPWAISPACRN